MAARYALLLYAALGWEDILILLPTAGNGRSSDQNVILPASFGPLVWSVCLACRDNALKVD